MPGIVGIVNFGMPEEAARNFCGRMIRPLVHYPWYRWAKATAPHAGLAVVSLGAFSDSLPCVLNEDGHQLAFEGELVNLAEVSAALGQGLAENAGTHRQSRVVLQALLRWGTSALNRFNGLYQLAFWDAHNLELILAGDRGGLRPVYFVHQDGFLAFAPEVKALLALPQVARELDAAGLMDFLQYGFPLGERTFFSHIKALAGGSFIRFSPAKFQTQRYWRMSFVEKSSMRLRESQQRFVDTWREAMKRHTHEGISFGSLLSGGLDSRLILATLVDQGERAPAFTMGNPGSADATIAEKVVEVIGCAHFFRPVVPSEAMDGLERAVFLTDGMFNCFHANVRHLLPALAAEVGGAFDGINPLDSFYHAVEVPVNRWLGTDPMKWLMRATNYKGDIRAFQLHGEKTVRLIEPGFAHQTRNQQSFLAGFVQNAAQIVKGPLATLDLFNFEQRQRRMTAFGPNLIRTVVEVRCPFYDKGILELATELPSLHRCEDKPLIKFALRQIHPVAASIPWERTGLPVTASLLRTQARKGMRFLRREFVRAISQNQNAKKSRAPGVDYAGMLRTSPQLQRYVTSTLLDHGRDSSGLFNRHGIHELLNYHLAGTGNHADVLGRILTIELWHRLFVAHVQPSEPLPKFADRPLPHWSVKT